jgi:hypothetical protein
MCVFRMTAPHSKNLASSQSKSKDGDHLVPHYPTHSRICPTPKSNSHFTRPSANNFASSRHFMHRANTREESLVCTSAHTCARRNCGDAKMLLSLPPFHPSTRPSSRPSAPPPARPHSFAAALGLSRGRFYRDAICISLTLFSARQTRWRLLWYNATPGSTSLLFTASDCRRRWRAVPNPFYIVFLRLRRCLRGLQEHLNLCRLCAFSCVVFVGLIRLNDFARGLILLMD